MADEPGVLRCTGCDRLIEVCVACDGPECPRPICYPDLVVAVRQSIRQPHAHGG